MQLDKIDFSNGMWRGLLTAENSSTSPSFSVELNGAVVEGTRISEGPSNREWVIDIPIPNHAIGDGVYTFLIFVQGNSVPVGSFAYRQAVQWNMICKPKLPCCGKSWKF